MRESMSTPSSRPPSSGDKRALRILAKSVYRELKANGYSRSDIVGFTNELLELMSSEIKNGDSQEPSAA